MRITKEIAFQCAKILTSRKMDEIKADEKRLGEAVAALYKSELPADVMAVFNNHRSFFNKASMIYLTNPYGKYGVYISEELPCGQGGPSIKNIEDNRDLIADYDKIAARRERMKNTKTQLESAIFSMRTASNVMSQFPELSEYLNGIEKKDALPVSVQKIKDAIGNI